MANLTFDFLHHYQRGERRESDPANAYQYDEGHLIEAVLPETVTSVELHYWTRGMEEAEAYTPSSITANDDGSCTVLGNIPNKFFETDGDLRVYIVVNDAEASITTYEGKIHVVHRAMPDDYVDEDPDNPATRILTEARAAAATATAAAQTAQNVADSIPSDYSQMSEDVTQLKEELNDNVSDLKSALSDVTGNTEIILTSGYIATDGETANINSVVAHTTYHHAVIPCQAGDFFTINCIGGSTPRAYAFINNNNSGEILKVARNSESVTNYVVAAPENATHLIINDAGGSEKSYKGIKNKILTDNNHFGVFADEIFTLSRDAGSGTRIIPIGKILRKGAYLKIKNNHASASMNVTFLNEQLEETGDIVTLTKSGTATDTNALVLTDDTYFIRTYWLNGYNFTLTYGQNIGKTITENLNGYFTKSSGVYGYTTSSRYKQHRYKLNKGTYTVITRMPVTTETNVLAWVVSRNETIADKDIIADSSVVSIQTAGEYTYTITISEDNCYLFVAQANPYATEPFVSTIEQKYDYNFFMNAALMNNLNVNNGRITRGTNVGYFAFNLYDYWKTPSIVRAKVGYSDSAPYIQIRGNNTYNNIRMELYPSEINGIAELRIPPLTAGLNQYYTITLAFPVDSYVDFIEIVAENTPHRRSTYDGIDVNAHLGFTSLSPENTMPSFIAAYESRYDAIICNPKKTLDGVWVCCHDATINRTARNADGTEIASTVTIAETNYSDLLAYDFGIAYNSAFAGTKIPTMEEYLKLCAITGIRPIFSMHQNSGAETLLPLVKKYGLLKKLVLKVSATSLDYYYGLFGDIYMYDVVINDPSGILTDIIADIKASSAYQSCRTMIDVPITYISAEVASQITSEGILCGVYDLQQTLFAKYKTFVGYGVTQFTDDRYPVVGLRWV